MRSFSLSHITCTAFPGVIHILWVSVDWDYPLLVFGEFGLSELVRERLYQRDLQKFDEPFGHFYF